MPGIAKAVTRHPPFLRSFIVLDYLLIFSFQRLTPFFMPLAYFDSFILFIIQFYLNICFS